MEPTETICNWRVKWIGCRIKAWRFLQIETVDPHAFIAAICGTIIAAEHKLSKGYPTTIIVEQTAFTFVNPYMVIVYYWMDGWPLLKSKAGRRLKTCAYFVFRMSVGCVSTKIYLVTFQPCLIYSFSLLIILTMNLTLNMKY